MPSRNKEKEKTMRIGGGWTRTSEKNGKTFISIAFDKEFLELCPQLKECGMMLSYVSPEDRKSEKAPGWTVNLIKNDDNSNKKQNTAAAEQAIQQEGATQAADEATVGDEEIPY